MTASLATLLLGLFIISLVTRWLPYVFAKYLKKAEMIQSIGKLLPAYIMCLLLVYEVHIETFLHVPYGVPELVSLSVLTLVHLWRRQLLLSLCVGSACYLLLLHYIF
tara:strand:- start:231 stop:551 length:321 start_codon:yes stop_codon:yes gene_type:complete